MTKEKYIPRTALVACSRLVDFAGAEIASLEIAQALRDLGVEVELAALEIGAPVEEEMRMSGIKYIDLSTASISGREFDLLWVSHYVVAYHLLIKEELRVKTGVYSSLSHFESLETPPLSSLFFSRYTVNSEENFSYFVNRYPHFKERLEVFPNAAPASFLNAYRKSVDSEIKSIAVISNHPPSELIELINLLRNDGVEVDLIGIEGKTIRVTPEILSQYSNVITIGKTVQYCLVTGTPVFCYDHFGGPGWITLESFDIASRQNFSGRCTLLRRPAERILVELFAGFRSALNQREALRDLARTRFNLAENILNVITTAHKSSIEVAISATDREILSRESSLFSNLRHIVGQYQQAIVESSGQLSNLSHAVAERDEQISNLSRSVAERDEQIAGLNQIVVERDGQILQITNSNSWIITKPLRSVARWLVRNRDNFSARIEWAKFLLQRSRAVIRYQGFGVFLDRALRYVNSWGRRKLAAFRRSNAQRAAGAVTASTEASVLVSFIIPIYDRTDVLRTAICSALAQTVRNIEVVLVTDGSPKETLAIVNEFADDPRVRIFNYPRSSGNAVRGRNKGISEARGRYIAFLDSDDVATQDRLERSLPLLESGEADVVYGAWQAIVDGSRDIPGILNGQVVLSPDADIKMLLEVCVPCQSTVIVRRSLFEAAGLLKPMMQYREDHELWARLAYYGAAFKSVHNVLTKLRLHSGNNELNFKNSDSSWLEKVYTEYVKPGPLPKKIAFILPGVGISGGIAVVFKHASLLMAAGYDAFVINVGDVGDGGWFSSNPVPIVHVSDSRSYIFDRIDLLFATGWSTVEWLARFSAVRKLYFVQSDERRFFDEPALKQKIHDGYHTQCEYLTEALWIKEMLRSEFGHHAAYVPNGLDTAHFYPDSPLEIKKPGKIRVLLEGPIIIPFKGMADSYAAIEGLDCEIWIVSSAGKPPESWKYDRVFERVPFGEMRAIYSSCDIFLKMSRIEGFFGPPMEAMACGCAVVVGKVTGFDEYIIHEKNALVVEQGDVSSAREAVKRLLEDSELRSRLVDEGHETVKNWTWERSFESMLKVVDGVPN